MKRSGDRVIGKSGDRKRKLTAEARRRGENLRRSDFSDRSIARDHPITRSSASAALRNLLQIIRAALREIFDESAYDRFLQRTRATRSITSYHAFTRERDAAIARKPRCC
jgi:hypothetical protein